MFSDGKLVPEKVGEAAEVKPCAGVKGTQITVLLKSHWLCFNWLIGFLVRTGGRSFF